MKSKEFLRKLNKKDNYKGSPHKSVGNISKSSHKHTYVKEFILFENNWLEGVKKPVLYRVTYCTQCGRVKDYEWFYLNGRFLVSCSNIVAVRNLFRNPPVKVYKGEIHSVIKQLDLQELFDEDK